MKRITESTALLALSLGLCLAACGGSSDGDGADTEGTGSGTAGTSVATPPVSDNGNGDGGNGSGPPCPLGSDGCPCSASDYCDMGLVCEEGMCGEPGSVDGSGTDTGTGTAGATDDTGSGDSGGSTDETTGNGKNACADDAFIEILAVDANTIVGWDQVTSQSGEGEVLVWDGETPVASVEWDLDIPCDDDWHIWVRALDAQGQDAFFVQVDDGPMPIPIFEIDCTDGPMPGGYAWRELNWRDQDAKRCEYVEDPWVQENWQEGPHTFTLGYQPGESFALSRIWLTNTEDTPPG